MSEEREKKELAMHELGMSAETRHRNRSGCACAASWRVRPRISSVILIPYGRVSSAAESRGQVLKGKRAHIQEGANMGLKSLSALKSCTADKSSSLKSKCSIMCAKPEKEGEMMTGNAFSVSRLG